MSILEKARDQIAKLFDTYMEATGARPSSVSLAVSTDSKLYSRLSTLDMRLSTVDSVKQKFSAIWPDELPWPDGVDRPQVDASERHTGPRGRRSNLHPDWPPGIDWPSDIPRPEASASA